jgi:hypothetical protein
MPKEPANKNRLNEQTMKIVHTALNQLGGIGDIVMHRKTDIFPALMESAYVLVLNEEEHRSPEEISEILNLPLGAVRSILEAPMQGYEERLRYVLDDYREFDRHTEAEWSEMPTSNRLDSEYLVGALAKSAYLIVRRAEGSIKSWPG